VFIRRERDALGPESPLLANEAEYRAAVESLQDSGKGLSGRMVVEFRQKPDADGVYRKYGAMYFRGRVVPQHLFMSRNWVLKSSTLELSPAMVAEEESYVFDNPHADQVRRIFELAETDFGRVDYAMVDGRIEVFEINTNPTFPRMRLEYDARERRRVHAVQGIFSGFQDLDEAETASGLTRFRTPKPKLHRLRNRSLGRRGRDILQLCKWRTLSWLGRL